MLSFRLSEQQEQLRARARSFARDVVAPHVREMDRTNDYPWPVVRALAEQGFMGLTIPRRYGGSEAPLIDALLVIEEIAKVCGTVARICVDANTSVTKAILAYGSEQQRAEYLPRIAAG